MRYDKNYIIDFKFVNSYKRYKNEDKRYKEYPFFSNDSKLRFNDIQIMKTISSRIYKATNIRINKRYFHFGFTGVTGDNIFNESILIKNIAKSVKKILNESFGDAKKYVRQAGYNVGDEIVIMHLDGEDTRYDGCSGTIESIDSTGQIRITGVGIGIYPFDDEGNKLDDIIKLN